MLLFLFDSQNLKFFFLPDFFNDPLLIQECICEFLWVFSLLISSHISLHSEKIQEAVSIILYCYNFLMASHVIYFGESFMDCRDECVLCSCWVECSVNGCQVHLILGRINSEVSLLTLSLDGLPTYWWDGILWSPTTVSGTSCCFMLRVFVLWNWKPQGSIHIYLQSFSLLDGLFPLLVCSGILDLSWPILTFSVLYQLWE